MANSHSEMSIRWPVGHVSENWVRLEVKVGGHARSRDAMRHRPEGSLRPCSEPWSLTQFPHDQLARLQNRFDVQSLDPRTLDADKVAERAGGED